MRIGLFIPRVNNSQRADGSNGAGRSIGAGGALDAMIEEFRMAEALGFDTAWVGHTFEWDALSVLALAGRRTDRIELGSWVVPSFPRHPVALAQQALTVQQACGNRLALGLGASHAVVIERRMGIDYSRPLRHMREMLTVLPTLLSGEQTKFEGEAFRVSVRLESLGAAAPPVILAALGPRMLELAGRSADGVAIWLGGARFLRDFALAHIDAGARAAGRARPRIIVGLPISVTTDPTARTAAEKFLGPSSKLPAYRKVLERQGLESAGAAALVGDESLVLRRLEELAALGVTDFNAIPFAVRSDPDAIRRTREVLSCFATGRG